MVCLYQLAKCMFLHLDNSIDHSLVDRDQCAAGFVLLLELFNHVSMVQDIVLLIMANV